MSEVMTPDEINGLIERLRYTAQINRRRGMSDTHPLVGELEQAADAITAANSRITELTAEIERLREALVSIINGAPENDPELDPLTSAGNGDDVFSDGCRQEHFRLAQIARAALSHEEGK